MNQNTNTDIIGNAGLLSGFTTVYKFCQGFKDAVMKDSSKIELNTKKLSAEVFKNKLMSTALVMYEPDKLILKRAFDNAAYQGYRSGVSFYNHLENSISNIMKR